MSNSEWCTGGIRIRRKQIKDAKNIYPPPQKHAMLRSKRFLTADTLEWSRRLPTANTVAKVHANAHARYEQDLPPPSSSGLGDPPWAGSPIPQSAFNKSHDQALIRVPHDDTMPWPLCRGPCETPKARVPHEEEILGMNEELASLVRECETLRRDDPKGRRPKLPPHAVPPQHMLEDRAKLIEDRCSAFENRWWDDNDATGIPAPERPWAHSARRPQTSGAYRRASGW